MEDTGWRKNTKTGGWFNIYDIDDKITNKYMNQKIRKLSQKSDIKEVDLSYQGSTSDIARGTGKTADVVAEEVDKWIKEGKNYVLIEESKEAIAQLNKVRGNPNAMITIYRATPGDSINKGDWVFLDKYKADRWSKSLFSNQLKPGYKVITMKVRANQIDWTGKNLEFMYKGVD